MTACAVCGKDAPRAGLYFTCVTRGHQVRTQIALCDRHGERALKHLKRIYPNHLLNPEPCEDSSTPCRSSRC